MKKKRFSVEQIVGMLKQAQGRSSCGGSHTEGRDQRADVLPMEGEVCWPGNGSGTADGSVAGGEHATEAACSRAYAGQDDVAGCALKKW